jgi:hypothetical protein
MYTWNFPYITLKIATGSIFVAADIVKVSNIMCRHVYYFRTKRHLPAGEVRYLCPLKFNVDCVWNVMAHAQKPSFVIRRNGGVHLNRRERQFSRLLVAEVCASAVVMLDIPCSEVVWRVPAAHSIRQFPLHFSCRASLCAITFKLDSTTISYLKGCIFSQGLLLYVTSEPNSKCCYCRSRLTKPPVHHAVDTNCNKFNKLRFREFRKKNWSNFKTA